MSSEPIVVEGEELVDVVIEQKRQQQLGISLLVTANAQRAYLQFFNQVDADSLAELLRDIGIVSTLNLKFLGKEAVMKDIIEKQKPVLIAEELERLDRIIFDIEILMDREKIYTFLKDRIGGVPPHKLPMLCYAAGTMIGRRRSLAEVTKLATLYNVYGKEIKEKRRIVNLGLKVGFEEDADGAIKATEDGYLRFKNYELSCDPVFRIQTARDWFSGDLNFIGSVEVSQDIIENFDIITGKDISLQGCSEGANLKAGGGVTIKEGIVGNMTGTVRARSFIKAHYANQAKLFCENDIDIHSGIFHSLVHCHGALTCNGGPIVGGEVYSAYGISAQSLGAVSGVKTLLMAGYCEKIPYSLDSVDEELKNLELKIEGILDETEEIIASGNISELAGSAKQKAVKNTQKIKKMQKRYEILSEWYNSHSPEACENATIKVTGIIYPGVTLIINNRRTEITKKLSRVRFFFDPESRSVVSGPLR